MAAETGLPHLPRMDTVNSPGGGGRCGALTEWLGRKSTVLSRLGCLSAIAATIALVSMSIIYGSAQSKITLPIERPRGAANFHNTVNSEHHDLPA